MFLFAQFGAEQPVPVKQQLGEQPVSELLQELETRKRGLAAVEFSFLPLGFSEINYCWYGKQSHQKVHSRSKVSGVYSSVIIHYTAM
ncbi:hypothetical protein CDAR_190841 [Caerostris darwini]|uniref:Uncharacterized protein n=1 Tax=Caerostris darwini TaxID=1538125 RepID=A0AAV4VDL0_9ARAC|nr:hypothetical protein CDAR_190841 [Caerostris darwini]